MPNGTKGFVTKGFHELKNGVNLQGEGGTEKIIALHVTTDLTHL